MRKDYIDLVSFHVEDCIIIVTIQTPSGTDHGKTAG